MDFFLFRTDLLVLRAPETDFVNFLCAYTSELWFLEYILLWEKSYVDFPNFLVLFGNKFCWLNSDPWSWGKDICVQKSSEIDSHSKWSLGITGKVAFIIRKQFNQTKYLMRTRTQNCQRIDFRTSSSAQIMKHKLSLPFTRDLVDWNIQRSFYVLSF